MKGFCSVSKRTHNSRMWMLAPQLQSMCFGSHPMSFGHPGRPVAAFGFALSFASPHASTISKCSRCTKASTEIRLTHSNHFTQSKKNNSSKSDLPKQLQPIKRSTQVRSSSQLLRASQPDPKRLCQSRWGSRASASAASGPATPPTPWPPTHQTATPETGGFCRPSAGWL